MLTDAHCHPFDLVQYYPQMEKERRRLGVLAAASAHTPEELAHNEKLAQAAAADGCAALLPCFAIHPQQLEIRNEKLEVRSHSAEHCEPPFRLTFEIKDKINHGEHGGFDTKTLFFSVNSVSSVVKNLKLKAGELFFNHQLEFLDLLAAGGRLSAVGEFGFDLFNAGFKETEAWQDRVFNAQMEIALRYNLPVVLHVRRAIHKIFAATKDLAKCKAVVFHSWSGTLEEGNSLLRRKVNAYFSFGAQVLNGHKKAQRSCALIPAERLLTETDAPFQPPRGKPFSSWEDLPLIIDAIANFRGVDANELETRIEENFKTVFTNSN
ncbi:MAG: TatD family hydrolase [Treponema sp.]|jgi:TatD DNase family protein|nr:TatD family hydrolase [Treponema sp.]